MGSLAHTVIISGSTQKHSKIPEYAKDFKNEWLYITGINRKCGEFMKILGDNTDSLEKVFSSSRAKALIKDFKSHFLRKSRIARHSSKNRIFYYFAKTSLLVT